MFKVNDKVSFGRPNGEQTLGIVEKVNAKSLKVRTLEGRGRRGSGGTVWRVAPQLCKLVTEEAVNGSSPAPRDAQVMSFEAIERRRALNASVQGALSKLTRDEQTLLALWFRKGYMKVSQP